MKQIVQAKLKDNFDINSVVPLSYNLAILVFCIIARWHQSKLISKRFYI